MMLAVSHLWLRTAPMSGEEGPSPVRSFLEPLNLVPYRALLKEQGFDDPDDFGNMSASDVDTMAAALDVPGVDVPGSTSRGRDSPGHWPARGRPGVGTHLGSPWPRCDIHYESSGVPDPPPPPGFRDAHIISTICTLRRYCTRAAVPDGQQQGRVEQCHVVSRRFLTFLRCPPGEVLHDNMLVMELSVRRQCA